MAFFVLIYVASIIVVNSLANFPLNDDWSFARAVQNLVEKGDWRPTGFTAMPLIAQSPWGAIFCLPPVFRSMRFAFRRWDSGINSSSRVGHDRDRYRAVKARGKLARL